MIVQAIQRDRFGVETARSTFTSIADITRPWIGDALDFTGTVGGVPVKEITVHLTDGSSVTYNKLEEGPT